VQRQQQQQQQQQQAAAAAAAAASSGSKQFLWGARYSEQLAPPPAILTGAKASAARPLV